jgi:hypothetical protein
MTQFYAFEALRFLTVKMRSNALFLRVFKRVVKRVLNGIYFFLVRYYEYLNIRVYNKKEKRICIYIDKLN